MYLFKAHRFISLLFNYNNTLLTETLLQITIFNRTIKKNLIKNYSIFNRTN